MTIICKLILPGFLSGWTRVSDWLSPVIKDFITDLLCMTWLDRLLTNNYCKWFISWWWSEGCPNILEPTPAMPLGIIAMSETFVLMSCLFFLAKPLLVCHEAIGSLKLLNQGLKPTHTSGVCSTHAFNDIGVFFKAQIWLAMNLEFLGCFSSIFFRVARNFWG